MRLPSTAEELLADDRFMDLDWRSVDGLPFFRFVAKWHGADQAVRLWADAIALDVAREAA